MNVGTWQWSIKTGELIVSERWADMLGYTIEELKPITIDTWKSFIHPDDLKKSNKVLKNVFEKNANFYSFETRLKHKTGEWIWVLDSGEVIKWSDEGEALLLIGTSLDITDRKRLQVALEESERNLRQILKNTKDIIYRLNLKGEITYLSDAWKSQLGYEISEGLRKKVIDFAHEEDKEKLQTFFNSLNHKASHQELKSFRLITAEGTYRYFETNASPIVENDEHIGYAGLARDITKEVEYQRHIEHLSYRDQLTNFYNRHYLQKIIAEIVDRKNFPLCIISIDINYLKNVNDTYGHSVGDELLVKAAQIIKDHVTVKDYLFRTGGDEFLIFLPNTNDAGALKIRNDINRTIKAIRHKDFPLSLAYGFHTKEEPTENIFEDIKLADFYMYKNKEKYRNKDFWSVIKPDDEPDDGDKL